MDKDYNDIKIRHIFIRIYYIYTHRKSVELGLLLKVSLLSQKLSNKWQMDSNANQGDHIF